MRLAARTLITELLRNAEDVVDLMEKWENSSSGKSSGNGQHLWGLFVDLGGKLLGQYTPPKGIIDPVVKAKQLRILLKLKVQCCVMVFLPVVLGQ